MADKMTTEERIMLVENGGLRSKLSQAWALKKELTVNVDSKIKVYEATLRIETDDVLIKAINGKIASLRASSGIDENEAIAKVKKIGLPVADILRYGLGKWVNQTTYSATKDTVEANGKEDEE